jgi:NitT/TauT family transport system substrate-binding protein
MFDFLDDEPMITFRQRINSQAFVMLLWALAAAGGGCRDTKPTPHGNAAPGAVKISIGLPREPITALTIIANAKGFFAAQGLNVTAIDKYPSGKRALEGLLAGEVDVTTAADVPIVFNTFESSDFKLIATVGSSDKEAKIIARRDRNIEAPHDLRGKRIATQRASAVHFFMDSFLVKHQIGDEEVTISFAKAENLPAALVRGDIDAFSMREPFIGEAQAQLGERAIVFAEPGLYLKTCNLVASTDFVQQHPAAVEKVVRALIEAEAFARANQDEAIQLVAAALRVPEPDIRRVWPDFDFRVSLDQALLGYLEDEARWIIKNGWTDGTDVPNYIDLLHLKALKHVKPAAVSVIE